MNLLRCAGLLLDNCLVGRDGWNGFGENHRGTHVLACCDLFRDTHGSEFHVCVRAEVFDRVVLGHMVRRLNECCRPRNDPHTLSNGSVCSTAHCVHRHGGNALRVLFGDDAESPLGQTFLFPTLLTLRSATAASWAHTGDACDFGVGHRDLLVCGHGRVGHQGRHCVLPRGLLCKNSVSLLQGDLVVDGLDPLSHRGLCHLSGLVPHKGSQELLQGGGLVDHTGNLDSLEGHVLLCFCTAKKTRSGRTQGCCGARAVINGGSLLCGCGHDGCGDCDQLLRLAVLSLLARVRFHRPGRTLSHGLHHLLGSSHHNRHLAHSLSGRF
mmetsp:Transcript_46424/g.91598  ORF Transcript_46424/g.91598 Transcript_46424/m.91598 type:complete len:324 (-) Transcript_46424:1265-2236(-)